MGCHFLLQGIGDPGIEPVSPVSPAFAGRFTTTEAPGKPQFIALFVKYMAILSDGILAVIDLPGLIRRLYDTCVNTHTPNHRYHRSEKN